MNKNESNKILPKELIIIANLIFGDIVPPHDLTEAISKLYDEYETMKNKELSKQYWKHFWD